MNMQFVNSRYNSRAKEINPHYTVSMLPFARKNYHQTPVVQHKQVDVQAVPQNNPNKIRWGPPTWFLFHTLAHKIKDEHFYKIKSELLNNIVTICINLPCPKCAEHATQYMKKINIGAIQTKDDLKNLLFKFHNDVNVRTGASLFEYNDLNNKYNSAVTINIVQNFFVFFKDKSFNVTAIANSMHRERITNVLKEWFYKNIQCFEP
uniref:thiol oxidase n=1 Tax=viral metagenome TaxID=1070528 RepID=A0A6C0LAM6_9ZZZZ